MSHISIFGLGRSGLAIARAAKRLGSEAVIYDQAKEESLSKPEILNEVHSLGFEVVMGWDGVLPAPTEEQSMLVVNPAIDMRSPILSRAKEQGYQVIGEIEFAYRISKAPIIAITGTNGKSTTTVMTYTCLKHCGIDAVLCGNIFGSGFDEVPLTEAALNSHEDQILIAEVSSFQLEWVSEFKPAAAGITNIWPDHQERYDSFEQYAATKHRIFGAQKASEYAVVKANDPAVRPPGTAPRSRSRLRQSAPTTQPNTPRVLTFGAMGEHARVDDRQLTILDQSVLLSDLPFREPHNFTNACMAGLLAFAALKYQGEHAPGSMAAKVYREAQELATQKRSAKANAYTVRQFEATKPEFHLPICIIEGLKQFVGLHHRMEEVGVRDGVKVINNSMCTNPDAILKSTMSLRGPNHVLIGGRNKNLDFRPLRHYFANKMHHAYVYGEAREQLAEQIGTELVYEKMEDAARAAFAAARSGEVVMLAPGCASTDQFRDFRHRGDVFKQLAKEWLEQ